MKYLPYELWIDTPETLQRDVAAWYVKHRRDPLLRDLTVDQIIAQPWRILLTISDLVAWLIHNGQTPALRCLLDFPDVDSQATLRDLWAAVLDLHAWRVRNHEN